MFEPNGVTSAAASSAISMIRDSFPRRVAARNAPLTAPTPVLLPGSRSVTASPALASPIGSKSTTAPGGMSHASSRFISPASRALAASKSIRPDAIASFHASIAPSASPGLRGRLFRSLWMAASRTRVGAIARNSPSAQSVGSAVPGVPTFPPAASKYCSASAASRGEPAASAAIPNFDALDADGAPVAVHAARYASIASSGAPSAMYRSPSRSRLRPGISRVSAVANRSIHVRRWVGSPMPPGCSTSQASNSWRTSGVAPSAQATSIAVIMGTVSGLARGQSIGKGSSCGLSPPSPGRDGRLGRQGEPSGQEPSDSTVS